MKVEEWFKHQLNKSTFNEEAFEIADANNHCVRQYHK
jgi:hypothetical protein